jgi:hypothetical protein
MPEAPHPESVIRLGGGGGGGDGDGLVPRTVQLKVHQCVWSGDLPENSLPAIQECYRERVARAEIDVAILRDTDFLVVHDLNLAASTDGSGRVDETRCRDTRGCAWSPTPARPPPSARRCSAKSSS